MELKVPEAPLGQQGLLGRVDQEARGPPALLDQGVHQATWGSLDHRVHLASLDTATLLRVLPTAWAIWSLTMISSTDTELFLSIPLAWAIGCRHRTVLLTPTTQPGP